MSERSNRISRLLDSQKSRAAYIKAKLGVLVPSQIHALRLKSTNPPMPRQKDLAREADLHQSRISMFETPGAANVTLETLANVAAGLKVGVIVKFVPFSEMLQWENSYSQDQFDVVPRLDDDNAFLNPSPTQNLLNVPNLLVAEEAFTRQLNETYERYSVLAGSTNILIASGPIAPGSINIMVADPLQLAGGNPYEDVLITLVATSGSRSYTERIF